MSTHDRGAFGNLMVEARDAGAQHLRFEVDLERDPEDICRWSARTFERNGMSSDHERMANGRTGEEALRRLVEKLRG